MSTGQHHFEALRHSAHLSIVLRALRPCTVQVLCLLSLHAIQVVPVLYTLCRRRLRHAQTLLVFWLKYFPCHLSLTLTAQEKAAAQARPGFISVLSLFLFLSPLPPSFSLHRRGLWPWHSRHKKRGRSKRAHQLRQRPHKRAPWKLRWHESRRSKRHERHRYTGALLLGTLLYISIPAPLSVCEP